MYKEQLANGNPKTLDAISNALIFEAKSFNLPTADDPVNVLSRRRTIGEYHRESVANFTRICRIY